jgi:hypothetical protein
MEAAADARGMSKRAVACYDAISRGNDIPGEGKNTDDLLHELGHDAGVGFDLDDRHGTTGQRTEHRGEVRRGQVRFFRRPGRSRLVSRLAPGANPIRCRQVVLILVGQSHQARVPERGLTSMQSPDNVRGAPG